MDTIDLTPAIPYLEALETAEHFPQLYAWAMGHKDGDILLDEAMEQIDKWCPHMWPAIDRAVLRIISSV